MSEWPAPPGGEPTAAAEPWLTRSELVRGGAIVAALAVIGVPIGLIWQSISPHTVGYVVAAHTVIPDESEALVASDGRFALLTAAVGTLAAIVGWWRATWRGPATLGALALGGVAGSLVAAWVGHATGGGEAAGTVDTLIRLPVAVRAHGLLFVEALVAVVLCSLLVVFAKRDDLRKQGAPVRGPEAPAFEAP